MQHAQSTKRRVKITKGKTAYDAKYLGVTFVGVTKNNQVKCLKKEEFSRVPDALRQKWKQSEKALATSENRQSEEARISSKNWVLLLCL